MSTVQSAHKEMHILSKLKFLNLIYFMCNPCEKYPWGTLAETLQQLFNIYKKPLLKIFG